jgi:two-component system response regulator FixJ
MTTLPISEFDPVYLVDDDAMLRSELTEALESEGYVVLSFSGGENFLRIQHQLPAGCVILDHSLPGITGTEVYNQMQQTETEHVVIMLTGHGSIAGAVDALQKGVADYVEKPADLARLKNSLEKAQQRRRFLATTKLEVANAKAALANLSERERDVLYGMMLGLSAKVTGRRLGLSFRTVESYRANMMTKLGVRSSSEIVRLAQAAGLVPSGEILQED